MLFLTSCSDDSPQKDVVVHDTLDMLQRTDGFEFDVSLSSMNGLVSQVHCRERTSISSMMWSGVMDTVMSGGVDLVGDRAYFNLRVYEDSQDGDLVGPLVFAERIYANVQLAPVYVGVGSGVPRDVYAFTMSYEDDTIFDLDPGTYWVGISDGGSYSRFRWAVENGHANAAEGTGGAVYKGPDIGWGSPVAGVDAHEARGYSLLLEGRTVD